ncbi:TPA: DUF551 domain-containing protein [Raoultella ornithinolytica]
MTSKLTREENVQAVFDLKAGYTLGLADVEILKRVARMALAAMDSEPVAYMTYKGYLLHAGDPKLAEYSEPMPLYADPRPASTPAAPVAWDYEWASCITCEGPQNFNRVIEREAPPEWAVDEGQARNIIPLYRHAQPAQVVPEKATVGEMPFLGTSEGAYVRGWNDCRAAMLQESQKSAGVSNNCRSNENVQVMQDVSRCSTKAAPALDSPPKTAEARCGNSPAKNSVAPAQSPIDHGYRPGCECSGCKTTVRICAELAGNSPVIPGRWIPVSERMPETDGNYWGWWSESKRQGPVWFIKSELQAQFQSHEITHWMPLPAAPQEVR